MASGDCESTVVKVGQPCTVKVEVFRGPQGPKGDTGPQGPQGPPGSGFVQKKIVVGPFSTGVLDQIPIATYVGTKWFLTVADLSNNCTQSQVWAGHNGTIANHSRFSIFSTPAASPVNHSVAVAVVGANMELQITNNTAGNVTARSTSIPIAV